ncbi:hypothetical protein HYC85_020952 [Camellia sinensis]|uniref:Uncharacterized protein n=1 Tax=Camellia sinensis TaxID=4442 RepID=A0A7J7GHL0_CAMSI|nr:hypothetical protein HYC85_020952 [Camellia sinensis]
MIVVLVVDSGMMGRGTAGDAALFLLKVAALETVRRFSRAKCPFLWHGIQVKATKTNADEYTKINKLMPLPNEALPEQQQQQQQQQKALSRPLLVLSIATSFSDKSGCSNFTSDAINDSHSLNDSQASSELNSEIPSVQSTVETRIVDANPRSQSFTNWLLQLYEELENQGITLPESNQRKDLCNQYLKAMMGQACRAHPPYEAGIAEVAHELAKEARFYASEEESEKNCKSNTRETQV